MKTCRKYEWRSVAYEVHRWKALAEIYTMHSFAPFGVEFEKPRKTTGWPRRPKSLQGKSGWKRSVVATTHYLVVQRKGATQKKPRDWRSKTTMLFGNLFSNFQFNCVYFCFVTFVVFSNLTIFVKICKFLYFAKFARYLLLFRQFDEFSPKNSRNFANFNPNKFEKLIYL